MLITILGHKNKHKVIYFKTEECAGNINGVDSFLFQFTYLPM